MVPVLEVPDNGCLVDYVTGEEMIEMFHLNWTEGPLTQPVAYSIGYHPGSFREEFFNRLDLALTYMDDYLYSSDNGPVIYATVSEMVLVWPLK